MKTVITLFSILMLAACGTEKENAALQDLEAKRDSLKLEYKDLGVEIKKIEEKIAALDSNRNLTLITMAELKPQSFEHYVLARGNVEAVKNTSIFSEVPGTVESINVEDGDKVNKGAVLLVLNTELVEKQIKEIKTQLELADKIFEKQKALYDQNVGSEVQFLEAKNRKETLENNLSTLKAQKSKSVITAPFTGVVEDVMAKVGGNANPAMPLVHMVNLDQMYISADVSESMIGKIKKGSYVDVSFPSLDLNIPSKIRYAGNVINENNRTFKIQLDINNTSSKDIKPNMVPVLRIKDYSHNQALAVNASNIQQDSEGNPFVYVANNVEKDTYKVSKKYIKSGKSYKGVTEIIEGLEAGALLVEKGARNIKDGQLVKVAHEE